MTLNGLRSSDFQVTETLLYDDSNSNNISNTLILNTTIDFLIVTDRLDAPLLYTEYEYGLIVLLIFGQI